MDVHKFLTTHSYQGNTLLQWIIFLALSVGLYLAITTLIKKVTPRLKQQAEKTESKFDDFLFELITDIKKVFIFALSTFIAGGLVDSSESVMLLLKKIIIIFGFWQFGIWMTSLVSDRLRFFLFKRSGLKEVKDFHLSTYSAIASIAKFLVWTFLLLWMLDNLGVNISTLVTGLGVGGIAIALAVQNILGDIFASLTIILDQPFQVGDYIVVGDKSGTVEAIGLKTSRVRSPSGEQLVFPNRKLIESDIKNFKRLQKRTITFTFNIHYDTPVEVLEKIPEEIKNIMEGKNDVVFDRAHFKELSKENLIFEVVYSLTNSSYDYYMDVQQQINLELMKRVRELGGKFAFDKTVTVEKAK